MPSVHTEGGVRTDFKEEEILAGWEDILSKGYQLSIAAVADGYPEKRSIFVSYNDINDYNTDLAIFMTEHPDMCIALGKKVIKKLMPPSWDQHGTVNLRIKELPKDSFVEIRELRVKNLGKLVAVKGLVKKATTVKPRMTRALFRCTRCGAEQWMEQTGLLRREPIMCTNTDGSCNKATRFEIVEERCSYRDTQKIEIQESPEDLRGGAQPEKISGYLEDDIVGAALPGDRVVLNGIIRAMQKSDKDRSSVFETFMEIISVEFEQHEYENIEITEEDEKQIIKMSEDPNFFDNLVKSISPSIFGLTTEKEAIALQLFGGTHKTMDDGTEIRGDIHVLFVGDPGVAKSQLLRYMSAVAPRGIYASGKSASSAGLCVHGDTVLYTDSGDVTIKDFVDSRMTDPEQYRPGIKRQKVSGGKVVSVTDAGYPKGAPVSYVWKIDTPSFLVEIVTDTGSIMLTPETRIMARRGMIFDWIEASELAPGALVLIAGKEKMVMRAVEIKEANRITDNLPEFVYDLTVEEAHSFLGNGFAVHNTAAAVRDDTEGWMLEAGALVLADMGLACVDELDKMDEEVTSSLHEALESQKISIAKAGITATLQSRCSLLAAANPKHGRFDGEEALANQINMPPTLLSRFDMIFIMLDRPDTANDRKISEHILKVHHRGQVRKSGIGTDAENWLDENIVPVYTKDLLRKYVAYSKRYIVPVMTDGASKELGDMYRSIRSTSGGNNKRVPITARQLEAMIRLAEASARARLSGTVTSEDSQRAIRLFKYSMDKVIGTDKNGKTMWDIDRITTGIPETARNDLHTVRKIIGDYETEFGQGISKKELELRTEGIMSEFELHKALDKLTKDGDIYAPSFDTYRVA